ncbi:MAG: hypothetical protein IJ666_09020 [Ruminococcus sp.]|nr:hypothetical protein [Ruminococcus sp.]
MITVLLYILLILGIIKAFELPKQIRTALKPVKVNEVKVGEDVGDGVRKSRNDNGDTVIEYVGELGE